MHDKAIIGNIGVSELDPKLITSVLQFVPDLQTIFHDPSEKVNGTPDVVFVNADSAKDVMQWNKFSKENQYSIPIMVTSGDKQVAKAMTIQRPINFKKLVIAFKNISSTTKMAKQVDSDTSTKLKILVVDDSLPVRKFMAQKIPELISVGVDMDFAASGEEGAQKIYNAENQYDVVFLDVIMPGVDGYKVCKWIKNKYSCNVIMLTSKSSPFDKVRGTMSGCDAYLTKPPNEDNLKKVLQKSVKSAVQRAQYEAKKQANSM